MKKSEIIKRTAPCSLLCHTCSAYQDGVICKSAQTLAKYLEGIRGFYERHIPDAVESYTNFEEVLQRYGAAACPGCRCEADPGCGIAGCFLPQCTKEHGVDFCGQCASFPCEKTAGLFEEEVYRQWLEGNRQIRDHGIELFWERHSETPHYKPYKK